MTNSTVINTGSSYTIPEGITKCRVTARGAAGQPGGNSTARPGRGALVRATLSVTASQVLPVVRIPGGARGAPASGLWYGGVGGDGVSVANTLFGAGGGGLAGQSQNDDGGMGGFLMGALP